MQHKAIFFSKECRLHCKQAQQKFRVRKELNYLQNEEAKLNPIELILPKTKCLGMGTIYLMVLAASLCDPFLRPTTTPVLRLKPLNHLLKGKQQKIRILHPNLFPEQKESNLPTKKLQQRKQYETLQKRIYLLRSNFSILFGKFVIQKFDNLFEFAIINLVQLLWHFDFIITSDKFNFWIHNRTSKVIFIDCNQCVFSL